MTRRVIPVALVLVAVLAAPAAAPAARFEPLTEHNARPFAEKLARQVAKKRKVRSWHLSNALSITRTGSRKRVTFLYSDRNRSEIFCTARLVVEQTSTRRRAFIAAPRCNPVPEEALLIEKATSAVIRSVAGQGADVRRSIRSTQKDVARCEGLVVPRSRHVQADLLSQAGDLLSRYDALLVHLQGFVTRLQEIQPEDPGLVSGVVWWTRLVNTLDSMPDVVLRPCATLLEWSKTNYSDETAPVDFAELQSSLRAAVTARRGVFRAVDRLEELGVSPRVLGGFLPDGLVAAALAGGIDRPL